METKSKIKYSVIRYSPDKVKGEIINIGLILHDAEKLEVKFDLLDEHCVKLKSILDTKIELNTYKSYRDVIKYYLEHANDDLSGTVGNKTISSFYSNDFLYDLYNNYSNKNLFLSKPSMAITDDKDKFFDTLFSRYVRKVEFKNSITTMTAKESLKQKFEELNLIGKKIKTDYKISPIKDLDDYKIKVDFTFKNGVWNYIQTIPKNADSHMEWYSKLQVMSQNLNSNDSKLYLACSEADINNNITLHNLIKYIKDINNNIEFLDTDNDSSLNSLCNHINHDGEDFIDIIAI